VPVASIDAEHGIVEFSAFTKDATDETLAGFIAIADACPDAKSAFDPSQRRTSSWRQSGTKREGPVTRALSSSGPSWDCG
jgi:hypothetical protein